MRVSAVLLAVGGLSFGALLGGCYQVFPGQGITNDYRSFVPVSAKSVATGDGNISYIANEPGTIYLIDHNRSDQLKAGDKKHYAPHVIGSYRVVPGQSVTVNGESQTIVVGATETVTATLFKNPNLNAANSYELRLDPQPME